jgi:hypothetical protein
MATAPSAQRPRFNPSNSSCVNDVRPLHHDVPSLRNSDSSPLHFRFQSLVSCPADAPLELVRTPSTGDVLPVSLMRFTLTVRGSCFAIDSSPGVQFDIDLALRDHLRLRYRHPNVCSMSRGILPCTQCTSQVATAQARSRLGTRTALYALRL